uniref:Uncharacterized protein n=1 Tax=Cacopsylla melanoneura TaxID=428564 RepID=A0A8D8X4E3_9HEMI
MNYGLGRFFNLSGLFIIMGYSVKQLVCCSLPIFSISCSASPLSSWGIQFSNWFAAVFHSSLSPACLFISTYEFKPNALTNWVQYFSGGRPLLHFFPIPSSSRWCSILSCLIMCPIITLSCFFY